MDSGRQTERALPIADAQIHLEPRDQGGMKDIAVCLVIGGLDSCGTAAIGVQGSPPDFLHLNSRQRTERRALQLGTKPSTNLEIETPIIHLKKFEIVRKGIELGAPLERTWSCYQSEEIACGVCDSCALRLRGFQQAGVEDPIPYSQKSIPL